MRRSGWIATLVLIVATACSGSESLTGANSSASVEASDTTAMPLSTVESTTLTVPATTQPGPVDITDGTLPLADEAMDDPEVTTVATNLAPSQVSATTVPRPPTPPECTGDQVELWTAQVVPNGDGTVNALIRVRNSGGVWCEPDIGRSPLIDPNVEPDVWLEPGQTADLWVGQVSGECTNPALVTLIQVGIGTDSIVVPSAVVTCGWWLNAFYPNDVIDTPCDATSLQFIPRPDTVLVRNDSPQACVLGELTGVIGAETADGEPPEPLVDVLFPGDIARLGAAALSGCDDPPRAVTLTAATFGEVTIEEVPCAVIFELAGARAWVGTRLDPVLDFTTGPLDVDGALAALDPFGDG